MDSLGGKYSGISIKKLQNDVLTYYISYRDENQKVKREKIGQSPEMNKTKALKILHDKKEEIAQIKQAIKGNITSSFSLKAKKDLKIYTLNDLTDFYFKDNASNLKNINDLKVRYNYHVRNELFAQKPIQLIIRDDLVDFIERKKQQKADKKRFKQEDKSVAEKDFLEVRKNQKLIDELKLFINMNFEQTDIWIYENKIKYLEKKNKVLIDKNDPIKYEKIWNDKTIPEDDKRRLLGLLANKTIREIVVFCSTVVNYANFEKKLNLINPFISSKSDSKLYIKVDNERDRFLTKEEIQIFLKEVKRISTLYIKHKNIYLMALFGLSLAARQSSIMSIKIGDIDLENGSIKIRNHKTEKWYTGFVASNEIKEEILKLADNRDKEDYLFLTYLNEKPYRYPRKIQEILDYTVNCNRSFLNWLSLKDFRNTVASHLAIAGVPIQHISKVLDHADVRITQRYAHLTPDIAQKGIKEMFKTFSDLEEE